MKISVINVLIQRNYKKVSVHVQISYKSLLQYWLYLRKKNFYFFISINFKLYLFFYLKY